MDADAALALIKLLASAPRPSGSAAEQRARDHCRSLLDTYGFCVTEEPFEFSAAVGRWATPLAFGVLAMAFFGAAWMAAQSSSPQLVAAGLWSCVAAVSFVAWLATRFGVTRLPWLRQTSVNLTAVRGTPSVWLVAHLDSKAQPVPMLARVLAIVVCGACVVAVGAAGFGWASARAVAVVATLGGAAALVAACAVVRQHGPGAVDNASGVAAVLGAAREFRGSLGVVLTSAEELGLAGARRWSERRAPGVAINVDTADDVGLLRCMVHGHRGAKLGARVASGHSEAPRLTVGRLVPGLLTDGVALAGAGWEAVTLSRGTLATLWRIHTPRDTVQRLTGDGSARMARLLVSVLKELA